MSQSLLFLAVHLVGLAICLAIGPFRRPALCCALAFPVGLAATTLSLLLLLIARLPYNLWTLAFVVIVLAAASVVRIRRRAEQRIERRTVVVCACWTAAFLALCLPLTHINIVLMTHDSHIFVMLGQVVVKDGGVAPDILAMLDEWGVFQVLAHSMAQFTAEDFLYSLPVVFGLSFILLFALTLWHGLGALDIAGSRRIAATALVTGALFTINMVDFHVLYLHTNMACAVFLTCFVAIFWLAEVEDDPSALPLAFVCLTAFALQRTETPLVALIFLCLTVLGSRLPRRAIGPWLAMFTVVVGLWYETLAQHVAAEGSFLTPLRCRMVWGALLVFFLWWLASSTHPIKRINRIVPGLIAAVFALALAAAFLAKTDHMLESVANWSRALRELSFWGQSWYAIGALILLGLLVSPPPFRQAFVIGLPVYFAFVLLLALGRSPYRDYVDDSANRMTIHAVPLIFWYVGLKIGLRLRSTPTDPSPSPLSSER